MQLVANWRSAWKWMSMQFVALALAAETVWMTVPPEVLQEFVSETAQRKITALLMVAAMVGRMIDQGTAKPVEVEE